MGTPRCLQAQAGLRRKTGSAAASSVCRSRTEGIPSGRAEGRQGQYARRGSPRERGRERQGGEETVGQGDSPLLLGAEPTAESLESLESLAGTGAAASHAV